MASIAKPSELAARSDQEDDQMIEVVTKLVVETFDADASELDEQAEFTSLDGWDSLNHMEFITRLETETRSRRCARSRPRTRSWTPS